MRLFDSGMCFQIETRVEKKEQVYLIFKMSWFAELFTITEFSFFLLKFLQKLISN